MHDLPLNSTQDYFGAKLFPLGAAGEYLLLRGSLFVELFNDLTPKKMPHEFLCLCRRLALRAISVLGGGVGGVSAVGARVFVRHGSVLASLLKRPFSRQQPLPLCVLAGKSRLPFRELANSEVRPIVGSPKGD